MRSRHLRNATPMRRAAVVAFMVAVVIALLSMPSSSAPGDPVPGDSDLPPYQEIGASRGVVTATQGAVVRRSKMYITVQPKEPVWGILYQNLFNSPPENPTSFLGLCARGRPCVPDPFKQPACATDDINTQRRGNYLRYLLYPVKPLATGGVRVGYLAETKVNLIAFGSIPATATVTMTMARANGKPTPFRIQTWLTTQMGCDTSNDPNPAVLLEGEVMIQLSDLKVDGVPVKLGPSCRTVKPASLALWGDFALGGYTPLAGGPLGAYDGLHSGSLGALESPYYLQDRGRTIPKSTGITIPDFTGCGVGEDLDPLVTAMASGPNNPVRVNQSQMVSPSPDVDLNDLDICASPTECVLPAPDAPPRPPLPAGDTASR